MGMEIFIVLALIASAWVAWIFIQRWQKKARAQEITHRMRSVLPASFIVFDLETTGLNPERHEIIEIAAIRVSRDSTTHDTWQALVKPSRKISKKITEITGISQEMLDGGDSLEDALTGFLAFAGDLRLVCYNAEFDMAFLKQAAIRCGKSVNNPVSCALNMARRAWPGRKSYRLTDVMSGFSTHGAHRALKDAELTVTVYGAAAVELKSQT